MIRPCLIALLLAGTLASGRALAQSTPVGPDPAKVRMHLGPLWMNPSVSLTNMGVDNNVFNEPDDAQPKRDFTFTVSPLTDLWFRFGRTWIKGTLREDVVWYQTYASERSGNNTYSIEWQVPLNRLSFNISNAWTKTRERPGFEIDARSLRRDTVSDAKIEFRAMPKTFVGVHGTRSVIKFDQDAFFLGSSLSEELNRTVTSGGLTLRHQLTPLTSITLEATRSEDRFDSTRLRDSNSTAVTGNVTFDPAALIRGTATFGYRDFRPLSLDVPGYNGLTSDVSLSYTLFGTTRLTVAAKRDVQYSFDVNQPYYLLTGVSGSVAQQVFGPFDVIVRGGAQHLAYRDRAGAVILVADRTDSVQSYGGASGTTWAGIFASGSTSITTAASPASRRVGITG